MGHADDSRSSTRRFVEATSIRGSGIRNVELLLAMLPATIMLPTNPELLRKRTGPLTH